MADQLFCAKLLDRDAPVTEVLTLSLGGAKIPHLPPPIWRRFVEIFELCKTWIKRSISINQAETHTALFADR